MGLRVRGRGGRDPTAPVAAPLSAFLWGSTPFLCARAKKWGGTGSRGRQLVTKKTAHTYQPPPQVGRGTSRLPTGSAHANGGAAEVKKALFFGGSTPFLWASTKEMGSKGRAGPRPPPKVTAHTHKPKEQRKGGTPGEGSPLDPLLRFIEHKRFPRSAERGQGRCPWTLPPLKRWTKLSNAREARSAQKGPSR